MIIKGVVRLMMIVMIWIFRHSLLSIIKRKWCILLDLFQVPNTKMNVVSKSTFQFISSLLELLVYFAIYLACVIKAEKHTKSDKEKRSRRNAARRGKVVRVSSIASCSHGLSVEISGFTATTNQTLQTKITPTTATKPFTCSPSG